MKVLVVGSGGREHALAWKLAQSPRVQAVYVAPGNAGTARDPRMENIAITDVVALRQWAQQEKIALTVVGPEAALAQGIVDEFQAHDLRIFGPTRAAAQLESSKAFAKAFMVRHGIPTAAYQSFSQPQAAHAYVDAVGAPIVIKADGLAAGKGVVVASTLEQAHTAIDAMLPQAVAGAGLVIEECLQGEEASFIVLADGRNVVALATSQDHKRLLDTDLGPNTGGMGAYSPAPVVTPEIHARVMREIIMPAIQGMEKDGLPYHGFLYAGLMIDAQGRVKTLEFNCRLGDPETQPILMRLKSDLVEVLLSACNQGLQQVELMWDRRCALAVVLAAPGYPSAPRLGEPISGLPPEQADLMVFHAGTQLRDQQVLSSGGRVLAVTALADTVKAAQQKAYAALQSIQLADAHYRRDIGHRAVRH